MEFEKSIARNMNTDLVEVLKDLFSSALPEPDQGSLDAGLASHGSSAVTNDVTAMANAAATDVSEFVTSNPPSREEPGPIPVHDASNELPTDMLAPPYKAAGVDSMAGVEQQSNAVKSDGDKEKKPAIARNAVKEPIPKTYAEACKGDKLVLYMRQNKESRFAMASAWSIVMGSKMTETNIGSRLSRIDAAFTAIRPQHECAIIKAMDDVERDAEEKKWGEVASKVYEAVGWKYPTQSIKEKYMLMRKSGFANVASNPNNSRPLQQTHEYPKVDYPPHIASSKTLAMEEAEPEDADDDAAASNLGGGSKKMEAHVKSVMARQEKPAGKPPKPKPGVAGKAGKPKRVAANKSGGAPRKPSKVQVTAGAGNTPKYKPMGTGKGGARKKKNDSQVSAGGINQIIESLRATNAKKRKISPDISSVEDNGDAGINDGPDSDRDGRV